MRVTRVIEWKQQDYWQQQKQLQKDETKHNTRISTEKQQGINNKDLQDETRNASKHNNQLAKINK